MHEAIPQRKARYPLIDVPATAEYIASVQKEDGEIPWSAGGKTDPWDHVESAMGLTVGGYTEEAARAYTWSARTQQEDGSWWSYYRDGNPIPEAYKDTNMTSYIAVGVFHYYLATGDYVFLRRMWPMVEKALDYVIGLQADEGQVYWAKRADGSVDRKALLTGSCSIYLSLGCGLRTASLLGVEKPPWEIARAKLGDAIRYRPTLFDQSKSRFSMDWYYPVLCGALKGNEAQRRFRAGWSTYVVDGWGALCVTDSPWVTMAETAELVVALAATGEMKTAETVFSWLPERRYEDGAFWTGVTVPDEIIYTEEKTAWTGAAVLLAADILYDLTSASRFFSHAFWKPFPLSSRREKPRQGVGSRSEHF
ncbi:MAG: phenyltransferase domain-containing protein [Deltaproteobacteria bacterium]|nr:phenyltransferase domain-containing protein [Deltaproteobacteria bacterium]MBW1949571.1 phenyltransferase domain-containing protein [Deltaproteobacteria bacterium]MBW2009148.1 phenyltransferase domain-containing protein [Deltaproteobacteria bacterium]MBW2102767.1 phenyltransferase domain-containing protein [Deltaproteobacteria bacterium]MBW2348795.1 phenyltransferase domain-containing protein [Deltaproteobacteria bacterium]